MVAPIGVGVAAFWEALIAGRRALTPFTRYAEAPACLAATLPIPWTAPGLWSWSGRGADPLGLIAGTAAREAWAQARLAAIPATRIALVFGTSSGGIVSRARFERCDDPGARAELLEQSLADAQTAAIADGLGVDGPRLTISTACTSATHALGVACLLLESGAADVVLAGGGDVLAAEIVAGFGAMGVMSAEGCAPFSTPIGMTLGEGAAFVVLERKRHARERGVKALAQLGGFGWSADGYHATAPDPSGSGMARAIRGALDDAGIAANEVGRIDAHATGTEANDVAEARALTRVLGPRVPPVSGLKGSFGHARGAAGALELVATVLALQHQVALPTPGFKGARAGVALDEVVGAARGHPHSWALKVSAAFGGTNAAVVLGQPDLARAAVPPRVTERVVILGRAADGGAGRAVDVRGMDEVSRRLTASAAAALDGAGLLLRGAMHERTGLIVAARRMPDDSARAVWDSIRERGLARVSAPAFARLVLNAAAGAASRALGLLGPLTVLAGGPGAALAAVVLGTEMLRGRDDADLYLIADTTDARTAYSIVLSTETTAREHGRVPLATILASALGGAGDLAATMRRALQGAGVDAVGEVATSLEGGIAALERHASVLVALAEAGASSAAIVLTRWS